MDGRVKPGHDDDFLGFRARRALAGRSAAIDIGGGGDETSRRKNSLETLMSDAKLQALIEQA